ncbi:lytic transglycosylase domain-containing protein [Geomobilimonas luticola]|uniref:Lytic transglycosylase domain-containing protein n=1 Tax=Geomobilimonas luticola TaxID=1114878 RepID=A0ABS5SC52_9BACT|nr:lytic transglycosylase domain-containing protein [Geomobilimonas luticola]MBT0652948.1 lytic transglycosylase domain-containing protein [Geomobilimonas luticola]
MKKDKEAFRVNRSSLLLIIVTQCALLSGSAVLSAADIYRYEDDSGVVHFTDAPTDHRFKIFMRDIKKDRKLRTNFKLTNCVRNPEEFDPIINACALEFGVDKSLVKAVIHAESGYDPNAVSRKGASGLMQLMPKTAQDLKVSNSFDPRENIRGGVRYLKFLLTTFKGDERLALAAYNAGLTKVAQHGGVPPYAETQNYVSKVLSYKQSYNGR